MKLRDLLLSAAAIAVLIALLAITDERVREHIDGVTPRAVSHRMAGETIRIGSATATVRDLALEHGALTLMVIAGGVLFVFMLRL